MKGKKRNCPFMLPTHFILILVLSCFVLWLPFPSHITSSSISIGFFESQVRQVLHSTRSWDITHTKKKRKKSHHHHDNNNHSSWSSCSMEIQKLSIRSLRIVKRQVASMRVSAQKNIKKVKKKADKIILYKREVIKVSSLNLIKFHYSTASQEKTHTMLCSFFLFVLLIHFLPCFLRKHHHKSTLFFSTSEGKKYIWWHKHKMHCFIQSLKRDEKMVL